MQELVAQAMQQGALGVSTALIYPPGHYAKTEELITLAKAAAPYGGIYASHMRSEGASEVEAIDEAIRIGREAGVPVEIFHLKVIGKPRELSLEAGRTPPVSPLAAEYRLHSWADNPARSHPLVPRNGADVDARLARCSLYRPDLDLRVEAPDGEVAGYGIFWADPVTRVGLVEPMRTEEKYQGRGIARHILTSGLARLAAAGCTRLKVSSDIDLYLGAGFKPAIVATIYAPPA